MPRSPRDEPEACFCTGRERFSKQLRNYLSRGFYLLNRKKQRKMRAMSSQAKADLDILRIYDAINI